MQRVVPEEGVRIGQRRAALAHDIAVISISSHIGRTLEICIRIVVDIMDLQTRQLVSSPS